MATRSNSVDRFTNFGNEAHVISWTGLLNGDDGTPIIMAGASIRSVQFVGTFGAGGTIIFEGSNDGTNYFTLTDPQGNAVSKTAAGAEALEECTKYVRPRVTAGDGTTDLKAYLYVSKR